jgi:hypothetical protein
LDTELAHVPLQVPLHVAPLIANVHCELLHVPLQVPLNELVSISQLALALADGVQSVPAGHAP